MSRVATFTLTYWNSGYMEPETRGGTLVEVDAMLLAGSAAIVEFILACYGHGRLLTTMRLFHPLDLTPYPNILAYLQRIGARPAYQRAMAKGDPDLTPMLT
ncbi:glutathione S-transferase [Paraburkholderia sp. GAS206C]|jgi:hypothetical protein